MCLQLSQDGEIHCSLMYRRLDGGIKTAINKLQALSNPDTTVAVISLHGSRTPVARLTLLS